MRTRIVVPAIETAYYEDIIVSVLGWEGQAKYANVARKVLADRGAMFSLAVPETG